MGSQELAMEDTREDQAPRRIGFVSTRFAGTDGVSLEAAKWARVLAQDGHACFWFAGELDRCGSHSYLVPEAHFQHGQIRHISDNIFGRTGRDSEITDLIHHLRASLKEQLRDFIRKFAIDLLVVENAMAIPMNLPLGLALAETISEARIPTIAHHHDFFWERKRLAVNAVGEYLPMAFPADLPAIRHVVINSPAQRELAHRRGIAATLIPNVLDFDQAPRVDHEEIQRFRRAIGLAPEDVMVLQPTRLIKRKGIEHAVELVKAMDLPRCKLVISHEDGDEGRSYSTWLQSMARSQGVDIRLVKDNVVSPWRELPAAEASFSLWTVYAAADLVTFCSLYEGFGNGLLEAVYFKKPVVLNRYDIFMSDIEPLGFSFLTMDGYLTPEVVSEARRILNGGDERYVAPERNYALARRHFSYRLLRQRLRSILADWGFTPARRLGNQAPGFSPPACEDAPIKMAV
jgi:glycosyltransferase involved in cell wall biosynthesis